MILWSRLNCAMNYIYDVCQFAEWPQCLALLLHSKKVRGCVEFACLLHAEKLGCSKLSVEVNVSVNGCFSLYISPVMSWNLSRVYPDPQPMLAGTVSSTGDPERDNQ